MDNSSPMETSCGLRKRSVTMDPSTPNLPLDLDVGYKIIEGNMVKGTPSPSTTRVFGENSKSSSSRAEFRNKQKSFEFEIHIEDCDEEELSGGSSDEDTSRPQSPTQDMQFPDCGGNTTYKEQPARENFLQVGERDLECLTDVSEGESDNDDDNEENTDPRQRTVIKRVPH